MRNGVVAVVTEVTRASGIQFAVGDEVVLQGAPIGNFVYAKLPRGGNEFQLPVNALGEKR